MSALRQLRLVIVGATLGGMIGSIALIPSQAVRTAAITGIVGGILLAVVTAADRLSAGRSSNRRPQTLIGKTLITLCAALVVLFAADLLVYTSAHGAPARRADVPATARPAPAVTSQPIATAPDNSNGQALPSPRIAPAGPAIAPTVAPPRSSAPTAAASPVATQAPAAPSTAQTTSPPQVSAAPSAQSTASSAPTTIIPTLPTLPPLPTLPLPSAP